MKKIFTIFTLLALTVMVSAQTTVWVYIPGDGERQIGFSLSPTFCGQHLQINAKGDDPVGYGELTYATDGMVNNLMGFNAGIFNGYETVWGRTIESGNYFSLYYGVNPFSGEVTIIRNNIPEKHKISYTTQHVQLHINPFITYNINEQFSVSLGIGMNITPNLNSKVKVDGETWERAKMDFDETLFLNILNFYFDGNVGVKYWFTDDWFVMARFQYSFFSPINLVFKKDQEALNLLNNVNGSITLQMDQKTANSVILHKNTFQAAFSIGYCW